jgi:predicted lysophospholipase L1 biosynthesis ABC-type transport system permease subunit
VGVVRNSAVDSLTEAPRPLVYHPWAQRPSNVLTLHVRTSGNPLALVEPVRRQFAAVHPELPALDPGTLADHMQAATFVQFVGATAFSIFGLVGLSIAAIGLHGVVAQFSAERRRDIAISMALGARPANVVAMVIGPALRLTSIGLVVGGMLSVAAGTLVRNQLVGVDGIDAVALAGAIGLLATITLAGCAWPTWRATRPDLAVGVGSI